MLRKAFEVVAALHPTATAATPTPATDCLHSAAVRRELGVLPLALGRGVAGAAGQPGRDCGMVGQHAGHTDGQLLDEVDVQELVWAMGIGARPLQPQPASHLDSYVPHHLQVQVSYRLTETPVIRNWASGNILPSMPCGSGRAEP